jgi:adenine-specific DNA-methyltransferase
MPPCDNVTDQPERLDLRSQGIAQAKVQELLSLFPEVRTEGGRLDLDRLKLALGDAVDVGKERYGMNWPGKADCFRTIQMPSLGTLRPCLEESVNFDATENLIIEGDNLEVLKLLQKSYLGKVKMIYIDPPYNTGNDFIYPDNYAESLQTYLEYTGQVDAEGRKFSTNTEADGRFHSKWLNMMYPRLYLARNLLRDDGSIFISIDDNEVENLTKLSNEIFGEENFVARVTVQSNPRGRQSDTFLATVHDYVLIYARDWTSCQLSGMELSEEQRSEFKERDEVGKPYRLLGLRQRGSASRRIDRPDMFFPIYVNPRDLSLSLDPIEDDCVAVVPRKSTGEDGRWMWGKAKVERDLGLLHARLISSRGEFDIFVRDYLERGGEERRRKARTVWDDRGLNTQNGTQEVKALLSSDVMAYPKPLALLANIVSLSTDADDGDIVVDFFAGSGTTAHAVLDLNRQDGGNRKFILVQLPEPTEREDYPTIVDITKERVRRVIKKLNDEDAGKLDLEGTDGQDQGFRVFKLAESNFNPWNADVAHETSALEEQLELHVEHIRPGRTPEDLLYEILLKSGFELTTPVEMLQLAETTVHSVAGGALLVCLEQALTLDLIRAIAERKPERVVCLDEGFSGNDQLKANAVQIFKNQGVTSFRTV